MKSMIPNHIALSEKALIGLKDVLKKDIGEDTLQEFTEKDLHDFGIFILTLTATAIQVSIRKIG